MANQGIPFSGQLLVAITLFGLGWLALSASAEAASCQTIMKQRTTAQQKLLDASVKRDRVEDLFNKVYAEEQKLKAQAAQARCNQSGSNLAACARIEPKLAAVIDDRRSLQNQHNQLTSQVSLLQNQVNLSNAAFQQNCGNGPPPPAAPITTTEQQRQANQEMMNTFIGIGIDMLIRKGGQPGTPGGGSSGGCPDGYHERLDGQPGCHKN